MASEDRPYQCKICRQKFSSGHGLQQHYDLYHSAPRRCQNCGKQLRDEEYHRC